MAAKGKTDFDVILLGAGFAGAATFYYLSRIPRVSLLLLEKENSFGVHASGKNAGLLRQALPDLAAARLVQETLGVLRRAPQDWPHADVYQPHGSLLYGKREAIAALRNILLACGADFTAGEGKAPLHLLPAAWKESFLVRNPEAWLHCPGDGVVAVEKLLENCIEAAKARGASFCAGQEALALHRERGRWRVDCNAGSYTGRAVVNAAGAWADEVAARARIPGRGLSPLRRHLYVSTPLEGLNPSIPFVWDLEQELYFRQETGGILISAGEEDPHPAVSPKIDAEVENLLRHKLRRYFPALAEIGIQQTRACLRTRWPRGPYLLEEAPEAPGFFWVAGLGGHGMGISLGLGALASLRIQDFLKNSRSRAFSA